MKKLLVIGAGFLQTFIIKKAKSMGYYVFAIDKNPKSIGFKYAHEFEVIDIVDEEACLKFAQFKKVDGVITAATDYGVLPAAYITNKMNLPGLKYEVAKVIKNKYEVRRILSAHKVDNVSQFFEITNLNDINKVSNSIRYPVMVKPCDGSGSKAAKRVDSVYDLNEAVAAALKVSLTGKVLIEDFIVGKEFGVESFVYKGKVHVLGILDKYMTNPPNYAELGHSMPAQLTIESKIKKIVIKAIDVLGINQGAINMDILVTEDGRICIIDIGARMGGNLIGSHIVPMSTGLDYTKILIQAALEEEVDIKETQFNSVVVTRILALKPGKVMKLPNFDQIRANYRVQVFHNLEVGTEIKEYRNNLDGHGYIVARSSNLDEANKLSEEAKNFIDMNIERSTT